MRKLSILGTAAAVLLSVGLIGSSANAAPAPSNSLPNAARNFSPIKETACQGYGRWCGPGWVRSCGPYRCWCRPC